MCSSSAPPTPNNLRCRSTIITWRLLIATVHRRRSVLRYYGVPIFFALLYRINIWFYHQTKRNEKQKFPPHCETTNNWFLVSAGDNAAQIASRYQRDAIIRGNNIGVLVANWVRNGEWHSFQLPVGISSFVLIVLIKVYLRYKFNSAWKRLRFKLFDTNYFQWNFILIFKRRNKKILAKLLIDRLPLQKGLWLNTPNGTLLLTLLVIKHCLPIINQSLTFPDALYAQSLN